MARLALDPAIVATVNAILLSRTAKDRDSTLSDEEIVELFESFLASHSQYGEPPKAESRYWHWPPAKSV